MIYFVVQNKNHGSAILRGIHISKKLNYPFILRKTDLKSVIEMFDLVIDDYNDKKILWNRGLDTMKTLKEKTSLSKIVEDNYLSIFTKFKLL